MRLVLIAFGILCASLAAPQAPSTDFEAERVKANELYVAGRVLEALPLYEDLVARDPKRPVFLERYAAGLASKAGTTTDEAGKLALLRKAWEELKLAQSLGDSSPYLVNGLEMLGHLFGPKTAQTIAVAPDNPKIAPLMQKAENAFAHNDYAAALQAYAAAAKEDPHSYRAALFAGDMGFRMHDMAIAGHWFAQAIAINPHMEKAYRYWGDALLAAKDIPAAREKYIDSVVAEPYTNSSWSGLRQWAHVAHMQLVAPRIDRPQMPFDPAAPLEIAALKADPEWGPYLTCRSAYRKDFHEVLPNAAVYRHSLTEEVTCLKRTAKAARESMEADRQNASLKTLLLLDEKEMLAPWVLFHAADDGIAQDYAAYRETHGDLLRRFLADYQIAAAP